MPLLPRLSYPSAGPFLAQASGPHLTLSKYLDIFLPQFLHLPTSRLYPLSMHPFLLGTLPQVFVHQFDGAVGSSYGVG